MSLPGGWEILLIVVIGIIIFGGEKAFTAIKKAGREAYKVKKEIDDIKKLD